MFLRGETRRYKENFYASWEESAKAARALRAQSVDHYRKVYKEDSHLPRDPNRVYLDFPGWPTFLGKAKTTAHQQ